MSTRLLLIDGLNIIRRNYEANMAPDNPEKAAHALRSATGTIRRGLMEHQPTHTLMLFDAGGRNWRHELFPAYKKDRKPMQEPLAAALPAFKESLRERGLAIAEHPGFEADDSFGSVAYSALNDRLDAVVIGLSTDKDMACLAQYGARIRDPFNDVWRDAQWCLGRFGIGPHQLQDWLALVGDKVDGVPGVEGIGEKTATELLRAYGSLEKVLEAAVDIPGKKGLRLREQADQARLSRQLIALRLDLYPDGLDWDEMRTPVGF